MQGLGAATPSTTLFRIGRGPNALNWVPWEKVGAGRYDDPRHESRKRYRVLYAGDRRACFYESLADFRPDLHGITQHPLTQHWIDSRQLAAFTIRDRSGSHCRWLEIQSPRTLHRLRHELAPVLERGGCGDLDISTVTSGNLGITQEISRWAFEQGYSGIVYPCRLAPELSCWALFEHRPWEFTNTMLMPLNPNDPDFRAVADAWNLPIPS